MTGRSFFNAGQRATGAWRIRVAETPRHSSALLRGNTVVMMLPETPHSNQPISQSGSSWRTALNPVRAPERESSMLLKVHHVGYLVPSLDDAVNLYVKTFGAKQSGRGAAGRLGEIAFIQAGEVEVELIQPNDRALLTNGDGHVYHHVGYVVDKLDEAVAEFKAKGYQFNSEEPNVNFMGYRLIYFDSKFTAGLGMHLTEASSMVRT